MTPTFAGEMQLAGWSESHTSGCKVTFWLSSPDDLEAFRALTVRKGNTAGHRFMAALVEIGDDEQPKEPEKPKGGELARLAGIWCADPRFWAWANGRHKQALSSEEHAAKWIREFCEVESRAELDNNDEAGRLFHKFVRAPFSEYLKTH
jgi:hypothetical protein